MSSHVEPCQNMFLHGFDILHAFRSHKGLPVMYKGLPAMHKGLPAMHLNCNHDSHTTAMTSQCEHDDVTRAM